MVSKGSNSQKMALDNRAIVDNVEQLELLIERVKKAQEIYSTYTQEQVDKIFKAAFCIRIHI